MKKLLRAGSLLMLGALCLWPSRPAMAEDRALLIGVGEYVLTQNNLPGIDLDINIMKDVAQLMGFEKGQIKVLLNQEANLDNTKKTMEEWLVRGTTEQDRVLIYYSGHGTQIPDENGDEKDDELDEALTMHDLKGATINGKKSWAGVLVDDTFHELLGQIKSKNVLVLVDACHSGTATKSVKFRDLSNGVSEGYRKFIYSPGATGSSTKGFTIGSEKTGGAENFVAVSAAGDNESSLASANGSYFTLGVKSAVEEASRGENKVTPRLLQEKSSRYISAEVSAEDIFHPQLSGSQQLAEQTVQLVKMENGRGPKWQRVADMVAKMDSLQVRSTKSSFRNGEMLELSVEAPQDGYLNVVVIDSKDQPTVLFPNSYQRDNHVQAGRLSLPGNMNFTIQAGKPYGQNLVAAFLSSRPVNMFDDGVGKRNSKGVMQDIFPSLSEKSLANCEKSFGRGFAVKEKSQDRGGLLELTVSP